VTVDVDIGSLLQGPIEASKAHLNEGRVAWYVQHFAQAEPVTVFSLAEGLLLVDGHHRVEAAQRLGQATITSDVHRGTRKDALNFAVQLAARQRGISPQVAIDAIKARSREAWGKS
jgi:ParB-like chromosome segregation protein Spo0J